MADQSSREISSSQQDRWDDFQVIMWGSTPLPSEKEPDKQVSTEQAERYTRALRNNGCTTVLAYRQLPNANWWKPFHWKLYAENINHDKAYPIGWHAWNWRDFSKYTDLAVKGDEKCFWRVPCLNDPAYWEESRQRLHKVVRLRLPEARPLCYSLGDEVGITRLTTPWDFCFCPHCMTAMRVWLAENYGSLDALNAEWGAAFASWDEVKPDTTVQARKRTDYNYSSWNDHRAFMDLSFVNFLARNQDYIRELDPDARVGIGGTQHPSALGGYDLWLLGTRLTFLDVYDGGGAVEAYRSFRTPRMRIVRSFGSPTRDSLAETWRLLLHGLDGVVKFLNNGFDDPDKPADTADDLKELQGGLYTLLKACVRDDDPIAIHFSQASIRGNYMMQQRLPTEVDNEIATESDHEREATFRLIEDLGLQWKFISTEQLERGELSRFKVLFMPGSWAVSDKEVDQIARFVENGGTVIANGFTAWMDGRCKLRSQAAMEAVFGVKRATFKPASWTVGVRAEPVYGRWNAFYSYYWWTCYPKLAERSEVALPDGPLKVAVMELDVQPTTATPECVLDVDAGKGVVAKVGLVFRNRHGKGQGILLNFRLLDYLDWRKAQHKPGDFVPADPVMARDCRRLGQRLLKSAGIEPRCTVVDERGDSPPGYERVYFDGDGNEYIGLLRDNTAATEGALDLDAFEANRAAQAKGLPPGKVTLTFANGGGHVYDVRQHRYLGRLASLCLEPHSYQPAVLQVSPYKLTGVSLSSPRSARSDTPIRLDVSVVADSGRPGTHVVNIALIDPQGAALPPCRGVNIVTVHGSGTGQIVFWGSDAKGVYTLVATEIASGLTSSCQVVLPDDGL